MRKGALDINSEQTSKMEEVKDYIKRNEINYMILIETNIHGRKSNKIIRQKYTKKEIEEIMKIEGYTLEMSDAWENHETSRIIMYCDNNKTYQRIRATKNEQDLQNITIEIGGKKEVYIERMLQRTYRRGEWTNQYRVTEG